MFGFIGRWAASACTAIKNVASKVVTKVKQGASKVWNAFTGKHYADEAEAILAEVEQRYEIAKQSYEKDISCLSNNIEAKISQINDKKKDIYHIHFARFMKISLRLHNVVVKGQPFDELFDDKILEIKNHVGLRNRAEIITIDFDKMGFLGNLGMVLTLGFLSRKKAKESLERAKQERERVNEEIIKLKTQQTQLKVIEESIDNVALYFNELIKNYSKLLDRFEYGIQTQRMCQMANNTDVFAHKLDFKLLPVVHLEEFRALFNLSIVLKQMADLGYLSDAGEFINSDCEKAAKMFKLSESKAMCA